MERYIIPITLIMGQIISVLFVIYLTVERYSTRAVGEAAFMSWIYNWIILIAIFLVITVLTSFFRINWAVTVMGYIIFLAAVFTFILTLIK